MKQVWPVVAALSIGLLLEGNQISHGEQVSIDLTKWTPPDIGTVSDDPFSQLVRYGHNLFTDTAKEIGPSVSDPTSVERATISRARTATCGVAPSPTRCL